MRKGCGVEINILVITRISQIMLPLEVNLSYPDKPADIALIMTACRYSAKMPTVRLHFIDFLQNLK